MAFLRGGEFLFVEKLARTKDFYKSQQPLSIPAWGRAKFLLALLLHFAMGQCWFWSGSMRKPTREAGMVLGWWEVDSAINGAIWLLSWLLSLIFLVIISIPLLTPTRPWFPSARNQSPKLIDYCFFLCLTITSATLLNSGPVKFHELSNTGGKSCGVHSGEQESDL